MKRTPIKRRQRPEAPGVFDLVTPFGDRYLWPVRHITEAEFQSHVVDYAFAGDPQTKWWHATDTKRSQRGWFDLVILQPNRGRHIFTELKVRDRRGNAQNPKPHQWEYITAAARCGLDVRSWLYPDDEREAYETLTGRDWSTVQL